jgi:hypothetical protein
MKLPRFSLAGLLRAVAACGFAMACLLYASAPWAAGLYSVALGLLVLALIGVANRAGARRAFWAGFAIAGWAYLLIATGPWFHDSIARRLATTRLLDAAYPLLIPRERQSLFYDRTTQINVEMAPSHSTLTQADEDGLRREGASVYVKRPGEASFSLLVAHAQFVEFAGHRLARIAVSDAEYGKITQAFTARWPVIVEPTPVKPLAGLWVSPPVQPDQFNEVGHALFAMLISWLGGGVGRHMYATRAIAAGGTRPPAGA